MSFTAINISNNNPSNSNPFNEIVPTVQTTGQIQWASRDLARDSYIQQYPDHPQPLKLSDRDRPLLLCNLHAFHMAPTNILSVQQLYSYYSNHFARELWSTGTHAHQKNEATKWKQSVRTSLLRRKISDAKVKLVGNQAASDPDETVFLQASISGAGLYRVNPKVDISRTIATYIYWFAHARPGGWQLATLIHPNHMPAIPASVAHPAAPVAPPALAPPGVPAILAAAPAPAASLVSSSASGTSSNIVDHSSPVGRANHPAPRLLPDQSAPFCANSQERLGDDEDRDRYPMNTIIVRSVEAERALTEHGSQGGNRMDMDPDGDNEDMNSTIPNIEEAQPSNNEQVTRDGIVTSVESDVDIGEADDSNIPNAVEAGPSGNRTEVGQAGNVEENAPDQNEARPNNKRRLPPSGDSPQHAPKKCYHMPLAKRLISYHINGKAEAARRMQAERSAAAANITVADDKPKFLIWDELELPEILPGDPGFR